MITPRAKTAKTTRRLNLYLEPDGMILIEDYAADHELALGAAARELIELGDRCHNVCCKHCRCGVDYPD